MAAAVRCRGETARASADAARVRTPPHPTHAVALRSGGKATGGGGMGTRTRARRRPGWAALPSTRARMPMPVAVSPAGQLRGRRRPGPHRPVTRLWKGSLRGSRVGGGGSQLKCTTTTCPRSTSDGAFALPTTSSAETDSTSFTEPEEGGQLHARFLFSFLPRQLKHCLGFYSKV